MTTTFLRSRTTLGVRDVPASIRFYQTALGFDVVVTMGEPWNFAMVGARHVGLTLHQVAAPRVADYSLCYFDVEGVEQLFDRCTAAGATIVAPLTRQPWGNYDFVVSDPDGHQLAFGEVPDR